MGTCATDTYNRPELNYYSQKLKQLFMKLIKERGTKAEII